MYVVRVGAFVMFRLGFLLLLSLLQHGFTRNCNCTHRRPKKVIHTRYRVSTKAK